MITWFGGVWGAPGHAWCLVWVLGVAVLAAYCAWWRILTAHVLDATKTLLMHFAVWRVVMRAVLLGVGVLCIGIALLHPQWGVVHETIQQQGRDIFIALDVSRSMLVRDVAPDRLTVAKLAITQLLDALPADRVGLMLFGEKAHVHCPLTRDRELVALFLEHIDHSVICAGTTRLDEPIALAIAQCQRTPERKNRLLVVLTDGEDFSGSLQTMAQCAARERLMILVIGVGTTRGAPIPYYDAQDVQQGFIKDAAGHVAISRLNEDALKALAFKTGGQALFVTDAHPGVDTIIAAIERCEKERYTQQMLATMKERYQWFLLVALLCLLLEWII